jgi:type I restriction enzyme S subunit
MAVPTHAHTSTRWPLVRLGDVCEIIGGGTPSKEKPEYYNGDIRWATVRDMRNDIIEDTENKITAAAVKASATNIIPAGNVIIATRVGLGKTCLLAEDTAINQDLRGIVPGKANTIVPKYLFYWFKSIAHRIIAEGTGATVQGVKVGFVQGLLLPLPPLAEQERIVARLDAAFAAIAEATTAAEANLRNARALFDSYLDQVFSTRGEGWVERRLGDVAVINYGYTESASFERIGPNFLRITDLKDDGVDWATVPYCQIDEKEIPKYLLRHQDIVFARTGATTGKSYLVMHPPFSVCASYLIRLRLLSQEVGANFVHLYFQTSAYWDVIGAGMSGSAQGGFNASKLAELMIPFPSDKSSQHFCVEESEHIRKNCAEVETLYNRKLTALAELKQALLAEVFGEG